MELFLFSAILELLEGFHLWGPGHRPKALMLFLSLLGACENEKVKDGEGFIGGAKWWKVENLLKRYLALGQKEKP